MHRLCLAAACGVSCPDTCGTLDLRPEIEPTSPALEDRFLTNGPQGKSPQLPVFKALIIWDFLSHSYCSSNCYKHENVSQTVMKGGKRKGKYSEQKKDSKVKVLVTQLCLTLWDSMDCSPLGSPVHGLLQVRILGGLTLPSPGESSQPWGWTWVSCIAGRFFIIWASREVQEKAYTQAKQSLK